MSIRTALHTLVDFHPDDDVAYAQVEALKQRVPYLYVVLSINIAALSYTHFAVNTALQVVFLPCLLVVFTAYRAIHWWKLQPAKLNIGQIRRIRYFTTVLGVVLGVAILSWALSLGQPVVPATPNEIQGSGHTAFFVGITGLSCIFLMMHLRLAAVLIGLVMSTPFAAELLLAGSAIGSAIALNLLLVTGAMLYVAVAFSIAFAESVTNAASLKGLSIQNARLAAADALTCLPNRRRFFRELEQAGEAAEPFAAIVIDLDEFKQVNDVYGHNAGDEVLRIVADRLQTTAPPGACVARLGGDEFACLLTGNLVATVAETAQALIASCRDPIQGSSFTAYVGASAGVCISRPDQTSPMVVYERADYALFAAKHAGSGIVETFSAAHEQSMRRVSSVSHQLRSAELGRELRNLYQPIVCAHEYRITAFEALVRWRNPVIGDVGPEEFIPIAERTDLIFDITRQVLRTALRDAQAWPKAVRLKVNLSVRDLMSAAQTSAILLELRESGIKPSRVTFEITETIFAESLEEVRANVGLLRSAGCGIAVDDFGVGYSSLNYIHTLAPNIIKVDRCFITSATSDRSARKIIRTILELARNVGAVSVAEGVETLEQALMLTDLGCDELQGHYFSKAIPAEDAVALINAAPFTRPAFQLGCIE